MVTETERRDDEDEDQDEDEDEDVASKGPVEPEAPDPNLPRNRAERRTAAKAARRGRSAQLADPSLTPGADDGSTETDGGLAAPTTSVGGGPRTLDEGGVRRPRVPPRTMTKGTGDVEGVPEWARRAGDWLAQHRKTLVMGALAVTVVAGAAIGYQRYTMARAGRAADAYAEALAIAVAPIEADAPPSTTSSMPRPAGPRFRTGEERLRASLERYRRVGQSHPDSRVAPLARLNEATALYLLGRYREAKQAFTALRGADTAGQEPRVVEGLAFTHEALNELDQAMERYRELQDIHSGAYRDQAQYYQARLLMRRNDLRRAKELLRGVLERTHRASTSDPTAAVQLALREQALVLMREIDPNDPAVQEADRSRQAASSHGEGGGSEASPLRGLPPELLQRLRESAQRQRVPGGATPPAPAPPPGGGR